MNYADEATKFLDEANEAEKAATWRSDELLKKADRETRKMWPEAENLDLLIEIAHDRVKEGDRRYKKHVGTNQWMLQKATANGILALVHGHTPSKENP